MAIVSRAYEETTKGRLSKPDTVALMARAP